MKKVISLLLAIATLSFATSAMAAVTTTGLSGNKNSGSVSALATARNAATMPGFRPGDTLTFTVNGANPGDDITLVTYAVDEELANDTVQYINQYTANSSGQADVEYTIRDIAHTGKYRIDIKVGDQDVVPFFYKVAKVSAAMYTDTNEDNVPELGTVYTDAAIESAGASYINNGVAPFRIEQHGDNYTIGFLAKVTVSSAAVALDEIGAEPGFMIKAPNNEVRSYNFGVDGNATAGNIVSDSNIEIDGAYSFVYSQTIYQIGNETTARNFRAVALTDAE